MIKKNSSQICLRVISVDKMECLYLRVKLYEFIRSKKKKKID